MSLDIKSRKSNHIRKRSNKKERKVEKTRLKKRSITEKVREEEVITEIKPINTLKLDFILSIPYIRLKLIKKQEPIGAGIIAKPTESISRGIDVLHVKPIKKVKMDRIYMKVGEIEETIKPELQKKEIKRFNVQIERSGIKNIGGGEEISIELSRELTRLRQSPPIKPKPILKLEETIEGKADQEKIFEEILEFYNKTIFGLLSGAKVSLNRPVCIILSKPPNDYIESIALICRELYRIVKGGKPRPRWISNINLKEEIERDLEAEDKVFIIDLENEKGESQILNERLLSDRLRELFSQDYGFIIFNVNEKNVNQVEQLIMNIALTAKLIKISPFDIFNNTDIKVRLSSISWGNVDISGEKGLLFDYIFKSAEKRFYERLENALSDIPLRHIINEDPGAGAEHEAIKIIVAEALAKELGARNRDQIISMIKEYIETEKDINGGRADIYDKKRGRYYEIETFYGVGDPISKLDKRTIYKYKERKITNVNIVLLGLHLLLYLKELWMLRRLYKEEKININFYIVDVERREIISFAKFLKILREFSLYLRES